MNKFVFVAIITISFVSCANEEVEKGMSTPPKMLCAYTPKGTPKEIVLPMGKKIYMDIDSTYFSGDMIFSKEQVELMTHSATRSAAIKAKVRYWPNKSISYKINSGFSTSQKSLIYQALQKISIQTNIQFTESNNPPVHHIEFVPTQNSFSSPVGMQSEGNQIKLGTTEIYLGVILHEIMHSLGFFHEHQRTDRDSYVIINFENIDPEFQNDFYKYTELGNDGYDIGSFDFNSVMMYFSTEFSHNGSDHTIDRRYGSGYIFQNLTDLSDGDINGLKFLYGPETLHLNREIFYESYNDDNEYIQYENYVDFRDSNGNPMVLSHPRLLVVNYDECRYERGWGHYTNNSTEEYYIVPSGSSRYNLNMTEYTHEEEGYGILRTHYETHYYVYNF